ncbi:tryptophan--tRNA ligase [Bartonella henselae]|uniref:Tryptophan--tRNA ligase n=1 Tax=Bartonella henselae TaxID=38323 RepID=Q5QSZ7_BARHN|nr:tryptophan--tRNA ligase [Bartonella henselae]ATP12793.1 tryptophan--tRNA ligase [Bartonella henselae]ETS06132.1 tryptophanyl-tRNA synthetase [Bartonella henselae JK 42]ETS07435.1 tryptophanyl-tRNA synthetase [Bartonella henselae JK 50]ETS07753.1 tryptophanyl-tRNA synthetase [Bartonella henselae JK 51]ETS11146.1 tryptophanyl-tRNA synthetase [Bartonella henselae JK 41]
MDTFTPLVFSGVQPSGHLHLGNYLGAIKHWVELQTSYNCLYCVVDMHALTVNPDPLALRESTRAVTAAFLAAGIDPKKHIIFNQSQVFQHAELAWILNCIARIGWLQRMTQFKDKAGKDREKASLGLFAYPSLMAADILLYRATHVPVGEDQKQHVELTRDIAQKFNNDYAQRIVDLNFSVTMQMGEEKKQVFFPLPKALIGETAMRVMSLRDGTKKMSKSDPSDFSRINLTDDADLIAKKIRKAKTDSAPLPDTLAALEERPEIDNLLGIYAAFAQISKEKALSEFSGQQFSLFKTTLADLAVEKLAPITQELRRLHQESSYIDSVLHDGAQRASALAEKNMKKVREIVGFLHNI